jgi:hypothetical protein
MVLDESLKLLVWERYPFSSCSGTKDREQRSHPHPAGGRQALHLHPPLSEKDSGVQIWRYWVRVRGLTEAGFREQSSNGLGPAPAVPAYGPGTEGAGTRVCGYAIKNSGLTVV